MSLKKKFFLFLDLLMIAGLIVFDQYTKQWAKVYLKDKPAYNLINGILELNYLENQGAAFGMLPNLKMFFCLCGVCYSVCGGLCAHKDAGS